MAEDNRVGLAALAAAAGMELPRLMRDYGHCVVARELYQGSTRFDAFIAVLESITGQVGEREKNGNQQVASAVCST